jgi:hypothetical protein
MIERLLEGLREIQGEFFTNDYFTVVYGSHSYGIATENSDLDFMTLTKDDLTNPNDYVNRCFEFYNHFGLRIASGVPHKNKLLVNFKSLDSAIKGEGFLCDKKKVIIPEMKENEQDFLESKEIIYRATLNALTGKPLYVCGERDLFKQATLNASESLVAFVFGIHGLCKMNPSEFVQNMISKDKFKGADFLGYKNKPVIREYLIYKYSKTLNDLAAKGILKCTRNNFTIQDERWYKSKIKDIPSVT